MNNDQASHLRKQMKLQNQKNIAKTICIVSGKGGVGKTNFAVNFSLELINQGKRVLIFDLDVGMGNVDLLLGRNAKKTIIDMFHHEGSIHDIIEVGPRNLSYIAGGSGLNDMFQMDAKKRNDFLEQIQELTLHYDYIIFDMGAGIHSDSLFFILAADECIVITTPEPTSITDAYSVIKHIVYQNKQLPIRVIINRALSQKHGEKVLNQFQQIVQNFLHIEIQKMGILPDDKTVNQSVIKQIPFTIAAEKAKITKAIKEVTYNFITETAEINKIKTTTFIQRLKQLFAEE